MCVIEASSASSFPFRSLHIIAKTPLKEKWIQRRKNAPPFCNTNFPRGWNTIPHISPRAYFKPFLSSTWHELRGGGGDMEMSSCTPSSNDGGQSGKRECDTWRSRHGH